MELTSLLFATITFTLLTLFFTFIIFRNKRKSPNPPPGSNGWPLVGETIEFLSNPEKYIVDRMKKHSPNIFSTMLFGERMVVICGAAGNKFIAANEGKCIKPWLPNPTVRLLRFQPASIPTTREEDLKNIRVPGFFRAETLMGYVERVDNIIQQHLNTHWKGKQTVNILEQMELMTIAVCNDYYLGLEDIERSLKLAHLFHDIALGLHSLPINLPGTIFYRANKAANAMRKELLLIIKEKKATISGGKEMNDMLAYMIMSKRKNGNEQLEDGICDKILGFLVAAFSSPTSSLACLFKIIGERPEVYQKIREEQLEISRLKNKGDALNWQDILKMKYTWSVCLEVMRYLPPLHGNFREATTDFTYEGFSIPKGWKIYWTFGFTYKNPEIFENSEEFVDTRFHEENPSLPYTSVPFAAGRRICPGKEFAHLFVLAVLHNVVKNFKWEAIDPNEKIVPSITPLPAKGLPARLISI